MDTSRISDPNFKEKYEKIMGRPFPQHIVQKGPPAYTSTPAGNTKPDIAPPRGDTGVKPNAPSFYNAKSNIVRHTESSIEDEASTGLYMLLTAGFVIFFIIYTLFWLKFFGVSISFLPFLGGQ